MNIAKEIRATRDSLGLTQAQCAKLLDIAPRKLWAWENGKKKPSRIEQYGILPLLSSIAQRLQQKGGALVIKLNITIEECRDGVAVTYGSNSPPSNATHAEIHMHFLLKRALDIALVMYGGNRPVDIPIPPEANVDPTRN